MQPYRTPYSTPVYGSNQPEYAEVALESLRWLADSRRMKEAILARLEMQDSIRRGGKKGALRPATDRGQRHW